MTAADIITTESVEILNGDLHIATLDEDSRLYIEMVVERGRGYVFLPKFRTFIISSSVFCVNSETVLIPARFKQL